MAEPGNSRDYSGLKAVFFNGTLKPVVDVVLPLADAADAHRRLEAKAQFGKIVLKV